MNRGGSWINDARNCRAAYRNRNRPGNRNDNLGFRLVLASSPGPADADLLTRAERLSPASGANRKAMLRLVAGADAR